MAIMLALYSLLGFILMSSFVTLGVGTSRSPAVSHLLSLPRAQSISHGGRSDRCFSRQVCTFANFICVVFYASSKLFTLWFLVERARLVHSPHIARKANRLYLFNLSLLLLWGGIFVSMVLEQNSYIREDGKNKIGQNPWPVRARRLCAERVPHHPLCLAHLCRRP